MRFSEINGLEEVKEKLIQSAGRNHHAQIFSSSPGSGNLALALAYTSYINCENPTSGDSCGQCPSCLKIDKFIHPDIHFIFPVSSTQKWKGKDVISNNFLPDWREFLKENKYPSLEDWVRFYGAENKQVNISKEESRQIIQKLTLKSFEAKNKVMIIWLPEWMHPSSANAILKILEEPPSNTIFLLVSHDYSRLLRTITSRTQLVKIRAFSNAEVCDYLMDEVEGLSIEKAQRIAELSNGNISMAKAIAGSEDLDSGLDFSQWMRDCWQNDFENLVNSSEAFHTLNKVSQKNFITHGLSSLRNAMLSGANLDQLINCSEEEKNFVSNFGTAVNPAKIEKMSHEMDEAYYHLERNASPKMTYLDMSLKVSQILKSQ